MRILVIAFMCVLLLLISAAPAAAGVEPTPWKAQLNKLNAVATQLSQIDTHLNDVLERAGVEPSPWMPGLNGDIGKLNAMANHLGIIYDRLDAVLVTPPDPWMPEFHEALGNLHELASGISERASNPPDPYRESPEAMAALEAVRNAAQAIVDLVDCFFGPSV